MSDAGRTSKKAAQWLAPGTAAVRYLHYGRIILDGGGTIEFSTGERETGLICLGGRAEVRTASQGNQSALHELTPYDAIYIPRDTEAGYSLATRGCDLAEISAPVKGSYPLQFVSYAKVRQDSGPALHGRRRIHYARSQYRHREERGGRPHRRRRHLQPARQLDFVASA